MKPNDGKRKMDESDDDFISGTPQDKRSKKMHRKKRTKSSCDFIETLEPEEKSSSVKDDVLEQNVNELFDGIDFLDDFNCDFGDVQVKCDQTDGKGNLDLSVWKRCVVTSVERLGSEVLLLVREENTTNEAKCLLQGAWINSNVDINDIVSLIAEWSEKNRCFCVNDQSGFIVTSPDYLVSGTSVVGSLFCRRKGVLAERFSGIDCNNKIMAIGSIVHEIFQITLKRQLSKLDDVMSICEEMLRSHQMVYMLYETQMSVDEVRAEMKKFAHRIVEFVARYVTQMEKTFEKSSFNGTIDRIDDIEENIWIPRLGLKGKVDVSVRVKKKNVLTSMPLEIKTGKSSFSLEHKGQVMLYQMMMSEMGGEPIDSGLLLYLREGVMKEVNINRHEKRGLIMLRNEVASYGARSELTDRIKKNMEISAEEREIFVAPDLPEPINHPSACSKCAYNSLCCSFLSRDESLVSHPLKQLHQQISTLTSSHIDYFIKWNGLLALEEEQLSNENQIKNMWLRAPEIRAANGQSVINLMVVDDVVEVEDHYLHNFQQKSSSEQVGDLTFTGITPGEYLRVSSSNRIAIAAGRVVSINKNTITMSLER
ncbi:DNA replication ATP-dependent helicase/nuclease DNA2 [Pseudolycoriella hygida]|uniref:DNA replication ATP-dependent helicase/nuclease DNA2 n=1 Tax=Pseudolycoriella hygida TaxID=35572 RepID=A0A9Q0N547_9DIPT|nr:DNA replication ATP-dependent helicase/nuclease DNA2 [Pseudolycoriella hygida]